MAEIKIEKRKPIWPWIVVVLIIAALLYFVFLKDNDIQNEGNVEIQDTTSVR